VTNSEPFAAGVHLPWSQVPEPVRDWAVAVGRGPILGIEDLRGGFSPGAASRLRFPDGDLFVKAVGLEQNPESPAMHRREVEVSAALPTGSVFPRLLESYDDGDWVALAFAAIDGRMPHHPWVPEELSAAVSAVGMMHEALTPSPSASIAPTATRFEPVFGGWERLASGGEAPTGLDEWSGRNLDRLAELEQGWVGASEGSTLVHGDIRSDNLLVSADGIVVVDWPHASIGSAVLDLVGWAPSVVLEGGPMPEELLALHPPSAAAEPEVVSALVAAVAGFFIEGSLRSPPPGLPTLRAFQAAQGNVARAWLQRRTGW
jgi:hypothetical protein